MKTIAILLLVAFSTHAQATLQDSSSTCVDRSGQIKVQLGLSPGVEGGPMFSSRRELQVTGFAIDAKRFLKLGFAGMSFGRTEVHQSPYQPVPDIVMSERPFVDEQVVTVAGFGAIYALRYIRVEQNLTSVKLTALVPEAGLKVVNLSLTCSTPASRERKQ